MAPGKRDGSGSSRMGIADDGQRPVLRSMLGLGRTAGYLIGMPCRPRWKALGWCNEASVVREGQTDTLI